MFNVLLQILDDGRLTDGQGRTVDFKNTIVIMTSNIGSPRILEYRGAFRRCGFDVMKDTVLEELRGHFRPEFLNRVDEIIVFHALTEEHLKQIVDIQLNGLRKRLADRHIELELTDRARGHLVRSGYDPSYGARPLKRAIQREIETPLARRILGGEIRDGHRVVVDLDPAGHLVFESKLASREREAALEEVKGKRGRLTYEGSYQQIHGGSVRRHCPAGRCARRHHQQPQSHSGFCGHHSPRRDRSITTFAPVVKRAMPAVVNISSSKVVKDQGEDGGQGLFNDPFFRQFFGGRMPQQEQPRSQRATSLGSGVVVSPDGYILTNNHVVDGATDVKVSFADKEEYPAKVIGTDKYTDVAVLKINKTGLTTLPFADSAHAEVGDVVLAIGEPFGLGQTVTMGIISAKGRAGLGIERFEDFIQTDAAINRGNSGGALIDTRGDLVGINTAILSGETGGNQGIGFAIPANLAKQHHGPDHEARVKSLADSWESPRKS